MIFKIPPHYLEEREFGSKMDTFITTSLVAEPEDSTPFIGHDTNSVFYTCQHHNQSPLRFMFL